MTALLSLLLLSQPVVATEAQGRDLDSRYFLFSGDGVAEGEGRFAFELDAVVAVAGSSGGALPALGFRYARGLTGSLDLRLSLVTLGVYNDVDLGVGYALVRTPGFGLGLRAGLTSVFIVGTEGGGGVFAATPGLVATLRGSVVAFSVGADVPMFFNGFVVTPSESAAGTGFAASVRPNVALELGGESAAFYIRADATIFFVSDVALLGHVALGVHF